MRDFTGIPYQALPEPNAPEFTPRLKALLANIDYYLRDMGAGIHNIDKGLTTTGQVQPTPSIDLSKFLFLPGRSTGQTLTVNTSTVDWFKIVPAPQPASPPFYSPPPNGECFQVLGTLGGSFTLADTQFAQVKIVGNLCDPLIQASNVDTYDGVYEAVSALSFLSRVRQDGSAPIPSSPTNAFLSLTTNLLGTPQTNFILYWNGTMQTSALTSRYISSSSSLSYGSYGAASVEGFTAYSTSGATVKRMNLALTGITAGATRTITVPDASGTIACKDVAQTFSAAQTFDNNVAQPNFQILHPNAGTDEYIRFVDAANSANYLMLQGPTTLSGANLLVLPAAGTLVTTTVQSNLTNKSIQSGTVNLTGQTAGIGTTTITVSPSAVQVYLVEVVVQCTTVSGSGAPTLDVTIGWTDAVGATTRNATADPGATAFPLPLSVTGRTSAKFLFRRASGNITYATTINAASGTPQYALHIRVLSMG